MRQLVEAGAAEKAAEAGDPWILGDLEVGCAERVECEDIRLLRFGVTDHGSELVHPDAPSSFAGAHLREDGRSGRVQLDGDRAEQEQGQGERQQDQTQYDVESALAEEVERIRRIRARAPRVPGTGQQPPGECLGGAPRGLGAARIEKHQELGSATRRIAVRDRKRGRCA